MDSPVHSPKSTLDSPKSETSDSNLETERSMTDDELSPGRSLNRKSSNESIPTSHYDTSPDPSPRPYILPSKLPTISSVSSLPFSDVESTVSNSTYEPFDLETRPSAPNIPSMSWSREEEEANQRRSSPNLMTLVSPDAPALVARKENRPKFDWSQSRMKKSGQELDTPVQSEPPVAGDGSAAPMAEGSSGNLFPSLPFIYTHSLDLMAELHTSRLSRSDEHLRHPCREQIIGFAIIAW